MILPRRRLVQTMNTLLRKILEMLQLLHIFTQNFHYPGAEWYSVILWSYRKTRCHHSNGNDMLCRQMFGLQHHLLRNPCRLPHHHFVPQNPASSSRDLLLRLVLLRIKEDTSHPALRLNTALGTCDVHLQSNARGTPLAHLRSNARGSRLVHPSSRPHRTRSDHLQRQSRMTISLNVLLPLDLVAPSKRVPVHLLHLWT